MDMLTACLICDGTQEADEDEITGAWQYLIDTAVVWNLQGFYGRTAMQLIEDGICTPANYEEVGPIVEKETK